MFGETGFSWDRHVDMMGFAVLWVHLGQHPADKVACIAALCNCMYSSVNAQVVGRLSARTVLIVAKLEHQLVGYFCVLVNMEVYLPASSA